MWSFKCRVAEVEEEMSVSKRRHMKEQSETRKAFDVERQQWQRDILEKLTREFQEKELRVNGVLHVLTF